MKQVKLLTTIKEVMSYIREQKINVESCSPKGFSIIIHNTKIDLLCATKDNIERLVIWDLIRISTIFNDVTHLIFEDYIKKSQTNTHNYKIQWLVNPPIATEAFTGLSKEQMIFNSFFYWMSKMKNRRQYELHVRNQET